jgi:hypothetical protein
MSLHREDSREGLKNLILNERFVRSEGLSLRAVGAYP